MAIKIDQLYLCLAVTSFDLFQQVDVNLWGSNFLQTTVMLTATSN